MSTITLPATPYTLHPTPYTPHPTPYTLHPTPYTLHPTPYTLHPKPYLLPTYSLPTPKTRNPTPCILNPKHETCNSPHPRRPQSEGWWIDLVVAVAAVAHDVHDHVFTTTRRTTTLSSKVNLPHIIDFRVLCCSIVVRLHSTFRGNQAFEVHCEAAIQENLAHSKTPIPLGPPLDPRHRPTAGSYRGAFSCQ